MIVRDLKFFSLWVLSSILLAAGLGCDLRKIGPPIPELFAKEFLVKHGYGTNIIEAVLEYKNINSNSIVSLMNCSDVNVRHMVARNSHLTSDERSVFINDKHDYVKTGVAMNPCLSQDEIFLLMNKTVPSVLYGLAMNPFIPHDILMKLHNEYNVPLSAFATNPNCPPRLINEIEAHGSSLEKDLLVLGKAEKEKGVYLGRSLGMIK